LLGLRHSRFPEARLAPGVTWRRPCNMTSHWRNRRRPPGKRPHRRWRHVGGGSPLTQQLLEGGHPPMRLNVLSGETMDSRPESPDAILLSWAEN
jgi:hypothetical protein